MSGPWDKYKDQPTAAPAVEMTPWEKAKQESSRASMTHTTPSRSKKVYVNDATEDDKSGGRTFLEGIGKGFVDMGRGVKQAVLDSPLGRDTDMYKENQEAIDEAERLDKPLMDRTAGFAGKLTQNVLTSIPAMMIPGGQTIAGSTLTGMALGAAEPIPTGSSQTRSGNVGFGGVAGMAGPVLARTGAAGYAGAKALAAPFTAKGRDVIAGNTLDRFGLTLADLQNVSSSPTLTGARPLLAEQLQNPSAATGAARLTDALRSNNPEFAGRLATREAENNAARVSTLKDLAGVDGKRDFYEASRAATSATNYQKAFSAPFDASTLSPAQSAQIQSLMNTPAVKSAMAQARTNELNATGGVLNPNGSIKGLHQTKMQLDSEISALKAAGKTEEAKSVTAAKQRLVALIEEISPEYQTARFEHALMSKPLNQMDVAAEVLKKGSSATPNIAGDTRLMPDSIGRAMSNESQLIRSALGRQQNAQTLADLLDPQQLAKLNAVRDETGRVAAVGRAANGPGSATADRLASTNVLRQTLGPTGLPQSWAESTLLGTAMRPVQFAYNGVAEPKIQAVLGDLLLDPEKAAAVLRLSQTSPQLLNPTMRAVVPYLEQAARTSAPAAITQR